MGIMGNIANSIAGNSVAKQLGIPNSVSYQPSIIVAVIFRIICVGMFMQDGEEVNADGIKTKMPIQKSW